MKHLLPRFFSRFFLGLALASTVVAHVPRAHAAETSVEAELAAAELAFAQPSLDDALIHADAAIKQGKLTHEQLIRAYRVLALSAAGVEQSDRAKDAFILLLTYDPSFKLARSDGPKVQQPYGEARGFLNAQRNKAGLEVSASLRQNEGGTLRVTLRDPTRIVRKAVVAYRWGGGSFQRVDVAAGEQMVTVPAGSGSRLDYYAQAFDDKENTVFEVGTPAAPKSAIAAFAATAGPKQEPVKESSIFASPLFWIATGLVVAGGATTGVFLATRTREESSPATSSSLGPVLTCGADKCR